MVVERLPRYLAIGVAAFACSLLSVYAATRYDADGDLTAELEEVRWLINRGRYAPEADADRMGLINVANRDYDACEDTLGTNDFGSTPVEWDAWVASKGPLAANVQLSRGGQDHSQDMAETGVFQHLSPSGNYYTNGTPPWGRTETNGYINRISGALENIATRARGSTGGYPAYGGTPGQFHTDLFVDAGISTRGHRQAILNATAREIGLGWETIHYESIQPPFNFLVRWTRDYLTQDFARRFGDCYFTGTIFEDVDNDGVYDQGEGRTGIEVRLYTDAGETAWYDASGAAGGFAIPIDDIAAGERVTLELVNPGSGPRVIAAPLGYTTTGAFTLDAGEARAMGTFVQGAGDDNVGFRNIEPTVANRIAILADSSVRVSFNALPGVTYLVEAKDSLGDAAWTELEVILADEEEETCVDTQPMGMRTYRVRLLKD